MAEVMLSDEYRSSLQSLENLAEEEQPTLQQHLENQPVVPSHLNNNNNSNNNNNNNNNNTSNIQKKQVTHGPTVVIQIPRSKRRKVSSLSTKQVVEAIATAVSGKDRDTALSEAIASFDHNIQSLHDEELDLGADAVLTKHLGFVLTQREKALEELSCTCEAIEMVYRASPQTVSKSFSKFGTDLLAMLIRLVNREVRSRADHQHNTSRKSTTNNNTDSDASDDNGNDSMTKNDDDDAQGSRSVTPPLLTQTNDTEISDLLLKKATKIMGHFARVGAATQPMAYFPGTLGCLLNVLLSGHPLPVEARLNSLWVLANLACNSDNMVMMACHPNLVVALIHSASLKLAPADRNSPERALEVFRTQSIATRALVNLSWAPENRIPLAESQQLLQVLCPLVVQRVSPFSRGRTLREIMLQSRRHSLGILRNLASAPRRTKLILLETDVGLLGTLVDAALNDSDTEVKEKAYATIHNLACHDTADLLAKNPALVLALKSALSEENTNLKTPARETLNVLETSISPSGSSYESLQGLWDSDAPSSSDTFSNPSSEFSHSDQTVSHTQAV